MNLDTLDRAQLVELLDLSRAAFAELAPLDAGLLHVSVRMLP